MMIFAVSNRHISLVLSQIPVGDGSNALQMISDALTVLYLSLLANVNEIIEHIRGAEDVCIPDIPSEITDSTYHRDTLLLLIIFTFILSISLHLVAIARSDFNELNMNISYYFSMYSLCLLCFLCWLGCQFYSLTFLLAVIIVPLMFRLDHVVSCITKKESFRDEKTYENKTKKKYGSAVLALACIGLIVWDGWYDYSLSLNVFAFIRSFTCVSIEQQLKRAVSRNEWGAETYTLTTFSVLIVAYTLIVVKYRVHKIWKSQE